MEKRRKELEKKVAELEANKKINEKLFKDLEKALLEMTGLKSLDKLDDFVEKLEGELHNKGEKLAEAVADLEVQLVDLLDTDSKEKPSLGEELNEI